MKNHRGIWTIGRLMQALAGCGLFVAGQALAGDGMAGMDHSHHMMQEAPKSEFVRTEVNYTIPSVTLLRQDGSQAAFPAELDDGRPVILDFLFTTCTAICPVLSHTFAKVQAKLGKEAGKVHMVTISNDPEYDTPARMAAYGKKYGAGPQWQHYTGTAEASLAMQKAFDVYRGDKMNHPPAILLRAAPGKPWVRFEGFASPDEIVREYHKLVGKS